jgi:hypothetical protein
VDTLYGDDIDHRDSHFTEGSMSASLPSMSSMPTKSHCRRRSSWNARRTAGGETSQLRLDTSDRNRFISPAPRALTQYIESTADPQSIILPSTLGLRSPSSSYLPPQRRTSETSTFASISVPNLPPPPINVSAESSRPVVNILSSLVGRASSSGPSSPTSPYSTPSHMFSPLQRGASSGTNPSTERSSHLRRPRFQATLSPDSTRLERDRSRSTTPNKRPHSISPSRGKMTPCIEELSASSSSSSDTHPCGYRTMQSLRKILDEQPQQLPVTANGDSRRQTASPSVTSLQRYRPPTLLVTHSVPSSSTSSATASISRLFTKAIHSSSTRPPSPPRHSSMKRRSRPGTPPISPPARRPPGALSVPDLLNVSVVKALGGSSSSSGRSTPKRISFAELPESYASSRPPGSLSKFKGKKSRQNTSGSGSEASKTVAQGSGGGRTWLMEWLIGAAHGYGLSASSSRDQRSEDRTSRSWASRAGMGAGLEDWSV